MGNRRLALVLFFTLFISLPRHGNAQLFVGNLFGGHNVLRFDQDTGAFLNVCASGGTLSDPEGMEFGPDGHLYVSSFNSNQILRYHGATCAFIDAFVPAGSGGLFSPQGLTFGPDGNLYVASWHGSQVLRYSGTTGAFMGVFASNPLLQAPNTLIFGPDGNLYVSDGVGGSIHKFNGGTGASMGVFAAQGSGGLDNPGDMTFGNDGHLYVGSNTGSPAAAPSRILRFNGTTGAFIDTFVSSGLINGARGLAFGSDGNLYVSSFYGNQVLRYNGVTGAFIDVFIAGGSGGLNGPRFLLFTPSQYHVCLLYDPNRAVRSSATIPIKIQLCDSTGVNLSSEGIALRAVSVTQLSTTTTGPVEDAGNANPDSNFRFDATLGGSGGYIYNLSTKGYQTGTYTIDFTVGTSSALLHAEFQVK